MMRVAVCVCAGSVHRIFPVTVSVQRAYCEVCKNSAYYIAVHIFCFYCVYKFNVGHFN